jgi:anti-sigma B factor antagonist
MVARARGIVVRRTRLSGAPMVVAEGELDIATAPVLEGALDAAIRDTGGVLLVELAGVTFMDSSALNVLLRARALLGREDRTIALVRPPDRVRNLLELAGVADLFASYETHETAARALAPAPGG